MILVDGTLPKGSRTGRALETGSGMGRVWERVQCILFWNQKTKVGGGVRNYPLITKELLTDEVNLYLLIRKHIQDALAEQYV